MIEVIEHTADVRLRITASTPTELFAEALRGTIGLLHPKKGWKKVERKVALDAADTTILLVDFLNDALSQALAYREAYDDVTFASLSERHITASLLGCDALAFGQDVKAVTYHEAEIRRADDGRLTTVLIFDI